MAIRQSMLMVLCVAVTAALAAGQYSGGSGDPNDPWRIADPNDLIAMGTNTQHYGDHFILTADIDLAGAGPGPGGSFTRALIAPDVDGFYDFQGTKFTGVFDGAGHVVSNLVIEGGSEDFIGLFGFIEGGEVRNLGLEGGSVNGRSCIGGLAGYIYQGMTTSSYATGLVNGYGVVGGLVGINNPSTITAC